MAHAHAQSKHVKLGAHGHHSSSHGHSSHGHSSSHSKSSHGHSSSHSKKHTKDKTRDREPEPEPEPETEETQWYWTWNCCKCGIQGGMDSWTDNCPEHDCAHRRCVNCTVDYFKLRNTR